MLQYVDILYIRRARDLLDLARDARDIVVQVKKGTNGFVYICVCVCAMGTMSGGRRFYDYFILIVRHAIISNTR